LLLLTGHDGFIGRSLLQSYPDQPWITFPSDLDVSTLEFQHKVSELEGLTGVIHCAGNSIVSECELSPRDAFKNNTMTVASVLESFRNRNIPVVILESDKVYGIQQTKIADETSPLLGFSPYEMSKVLAAELCDFYRDYYGMNVISLRLTNTYGPLDNNLSRLIPGTINRLSRGDPPMIWKGSETHRRDYMYITDLCDIIMQFVKAHNLTGAYNVTSDDNYSTQEVIEIIQEEMGTNFPILYTEKEFSEIPYQRMDGSKLNADLGYTRYVRLRDGIRKILDFKAKH
jgi:nucleoside-diphosphate-sugar epimerase